jgi:hypothetical protein
MQHVEDNVQRPFFRPSGSVRIFSVLWLAKSAGDSYGRKNEPQVIFYDVCVVAFTAHCRALDEREFFGPLSDFPRYILDLVLYAWFGLEAVRSGFLELYFEQTTHTLWLIWSIVKVVLGVTLLWSACWQFIELVSSLFDLRRRKGHSALCPRPQLASLTVHNGRLPGYRIFQTS